MNLILFLYQKNYFCNIVENLFIYSILSVLVFSLSYVHLYLFSHILVHANLYLYVYRCRPIVIAMG